MASRQLPSRSYSRHSSYSVNGDSVYPPGYIDSNSDSGSSAFVERRGDFYSYSSVNVQSVSLPFGFTNNPYHMPSSTSSLPVESTKSYPKPQEEDSPEEDDYVPYQEGKWGDPIEWEHHLQEERWKGDYEGHVRETPRNYGDLPVYYKPAGCPDGIHVPQCDYHWSGYCDGGAWYQNFYSGIGM
jgi:hypothetical protein